MRNYGPPAAPISTLKRLQQTSQIVRRITNSPIEAHVVNNKTGTYIINSWLLNTFSNENSKTNLASSSDDKFDFKLKGSWDT